MNFSEFLKEKRAQSDFHTTLALYNHYGSEARLGISFRQFQNIEAGKTPPSPELLAKIFNQEPSSNHHRLIQAYFNSHFAGSDEGKPIAEYVSKHLTEAMIEGKFNWDTKPHRQYSESQLDFLNTNLEALRFHRRLILEEKVTRSTAPIPAKTLKRMLDLELVEVDQKVIRPSTNRYRLPKYGTANPRMVARGNDFILKQVDLFLSKEGAEHQELSYAFQMVEPRIAETARRQLRLLKEWVQSHVSLKTPDKDAEIVPLIFVGFCKELGRHEIFEN